MNERTINLYSLRVAISKLELECKGMTCRGQSAYSQLKNALGIKGSKAKVLEQAKAIYEAGKLIHNVNNDPVMDLPNDLYMIFENSK